MPDAQYFIARSKCLKHNLSKWDNQPFCMVNMKNGKVQMLTAIIQCYYSHFTIKICLDQ